MIFRWSVISETQRQMHIQIQIKIQMIHIDSDDFQMVQSLISGNQRQIQIQIQVRIQMIQIKLQIWIKIQNQIQVRVCSDSVQTVLQTFVPMSPFFFDHATTKFSLSSPTQINLFPQVQTSAGQMGAGLDHIYSAMLLITTTQLVLQNVVASPQSANDASVSCHPFPQQCRE